MRRHQCAGRVSRQREDKPRFGVSLGIFKRYGGEGGGFAWFHGDAAKVDGAAKGALDGGFKEVEFAHGGAACGYDDRGAAEGGAEGGFESAGAREREGLLVGLGAWVSGRGGWRTCLLRFPSRLLRNPIL